MTRDEMFGVLDSIKLENDFYPIDEQDCREENASKIDNMEGIFDLKDSSDYTYLFAVAELLADKDKDKAEAVKDYLLEENSRSKEDVKQPEWEDKLLVSTAMEDNPLFFPMAWNWTSLVEQRLLGKQRPGKQSQADVTATEESDDDWIGLMAASTGNTQFGEKTVDGVGTLFIDYREKYGEFFVGLKVDSDLLGKKFPFSPFVVAAAVGTVAFASHAAMPGKTVTIRQKILLKDTGRKLTAVIQVDALSKMAYSQPFSVEEAGNPAKGFKYIGEPEIDMED